VTASSSGSRFKNIKLSRRKLLTGSASAIAGAAIVSKADRTSAFFNLGAMWKSNKGSSWSNWDGSKDSAWTQVISGASNRNLYSGGGIDSYPKRGNFFGTGGETATNVLLFVEDYYSPYPCYLYKFSVNYSGKSISQVGSIYSFNSSSPGWIGSESLNAFNDNAAWGLCTNGTPIHQKVGVITHNGTGVTGLSSSGVLTSPQGVYPIAEPLDATKAICALNNGAGGSSFVCIATQSGNSFSSTGSNLQLVGSDGSGAAPIIVRPGASDKSLCIYPSNHTNTATLYAQMLSHASTTVATLGSSFTLSTSVYQYGYCLSSCLDTYGNSGNRWIASWNEAGTTKACILRYDGSSLSEGPVVTFAAGPTMGTSRGFLVMSPGVVLFFPDSANPTFAVLTYNSADSTSTSLAIANSWQSVPSGANSYTSMNVARISDTQFILFRVNTSDRSIWAKFVCV
jgi:hypothetical protein